MTDLDFELLLLKLKYALGTLELALIDSLMVTLNVWAVSCLFYSLYRMWREHRHGH